MYKINELLKLEQKLFHTNDLALIWGIDNKNTLYTGIKRYIQKGILIRVQKGLYSTIPIDQLDSVRLGISLIHGFAYLSTESVLAQEGVISQAVFAITLVGSISKRFEVGGYHFICRRLKDKLLYRTAGIEQKDDVFIAKIERAAADILYFDPKYHFDNLSKIGRTKVRQIQKEVGYI